MPSKFSHGMSSENFLCRTTARKQVDEERGSFKVWYNEEMPLTQEDGWESFCKHFVRGLTIM